MCSKHFAKILYNRSLFIEKWKIFENTWSVKLWVPWLIWHWCMLNRLNDWSIEWSRLSNLYTLLECTIGWSINLLINWFILWLSGHSSGSVALSQMNNPLYLNVWFIYWLIDPVTWLIRNKANYFHSLSKKGGLMLAKSTTHLSVITEA